jgi:hypothetical protein
VNRAATHPGVEHSGSIPLPSATGTAEKIVTNPVYKLLAGVIFALFGLLATIALAYISLKISTIDGRLTHHDKINAQQDTEIRQLREWRVAHSASEDTRSQYKEFLESSQAQGAEFVELVRDIRNILTAGKQK